MYQVHLVLDDNTQGSVCLLQFNGLFESWIGSVLWTMFTIPHFFSENYVTSAIGEAVIRVTPVGYVGFEWLYYFWWLKRREKKREEKNERRGCKIFNF